MATPITPDTNVYLLKCPLEIDNYHQLNFVNKSSQYNYFHSLPKKSYENFSYQRYDGVLRINDHIDNLIGYNYVMYQNDNYSDKWFYAFITGMEYINDNCTFISIKTDVVQTWWFDLNFHKCFVEREHVNNDTVGLHTLNENIPSGEFVCNASDYIGYTDSKDIYVIVQISELVGNLAGQFGNGMRKYNGIPSGTFNIVVYEDTNSFQSLNNIIKAYDYYGKADAIINMYVAPKELINRGIPHPDTPVSYEINNTYSFDGWLLPNSTGAAKISETGITRNTTIDGYTPKNNKLFTRQFNYLMVTNNVGASATYYWELFSGTPTFSFLAICDQGCTSKFVPKNYKNTNEASGNAYSLSGAEFPICSWSSDYYLNWQAKNGINSVQQRVDNINRMQAMGEPIDNVGFEMVRGTFQFINAIGNVLNGAEAQAERVPDQVKGCTGTGNITFALNACRFTYYKMSVRAEVAKIADDYFSAYGYKVATYKVPNITGRQNWNYVKLIDANITGNIPQEDMNEIKGYFNRGITIWHNPNTFLDYTQSNNILS